MQWTPGPIESDFACFPDECRDQHLPMAPAYAAPFRTHHIRGVGIHEVSKPYEIRRVGALWHIALFTYSGEAFFECSGQSGAIKPHELWVGPAETPYRYGAVKEWKFISAALLKGEDFAHLEQTVTHKSVAHDLGHLTAVVEAYLAEASRSLDDPSPAATALAEYIGIAITRELAPSHSYEANRNTLNLHRLWEVVHAAPQVDWSVTELAEKMFVSVRQFQRLMKSHYKLTAEQMLAKLRMEHARELLVSTAFPLSLIGEKVGYQSVHAFSKAFKRYFRCAPGALRKRMPR